MTDTNQASEDELRAKVKGLNVYKAAVNMHVSYRPDQDNLPRFTGSWVGGVESLIRNEKLKLLAEVRERVVGEDKPLQGKYRASGLMSYDMTNHYENSLRAEQRAVLTKLEAEL